MEGAAHEESERESGVEVSGGTAFAPGLEGVVATRTRLSMVDGAAGRLLIAGFPVEELAGRASFEETLYLLWNGVLPDAGQLEGLKRDLAARRALPEAAGEVLEAAVAGGAAPIDALRMAAGTLAPSGNDREDALTSVAAFPAIVAACWRLSRGWDPVEPDPGLSHAANYLYMLSGEVPGEERVRALETYLNTVCDHGMNASTFTARVIVSTGSDLVSAVVGAVGALKGPLHGGAPGPALDVVFEIGRAENAEPVLRERLNRGERLMGFGHRVYKVRDPRADVLAGAAERLYASDADGDLYRLALEVERTALRLLEEYKPGRNLDTNVEFYTALLLHGLGLPTGLFTPTFAVGRVAGWTAHCLEQREAGRLIRPQSVYVGERGKKWVPLEKR
ncbi:Citrate synthase 1 [Rubrobacter xylanophilus DSM 9941]|uniref:citrate synthase/methylcitrate synthase n=1 Tax=Rubrobacter xylanophilus TaxID=49319 RepID=UPI001C642DEC|nr:citrate synthase/methylcitrate synthase [Rubrobacter xylanophilus]QYJ15525.1 Citrate synthase 1 [Rubrobacter xylanophilus DSM 9941]